MRRARDGQLGVRAAALTAYRVRIARLAAGHDEDESPEAAAGALLDAETAHLIQRLHEMYAEVHKE